MAARSAAGDLDALVDLVERGGQAFSEVPPYPADGLANPACGRVPGLDRDRPAESLLHEVVRDALAGAGPGGRTGLVVGTASGGLCGPWERWHRAILAGGQADPSGTGRDDPTQAVAARLQLDGPVLTVSLACVSGTAVFAVAEGWLRDGLCERVVVAGVDALSLFVHAGFSGLGALTASRPRPFAADRDGLLVGEGAAALVIAATAPGTADGVALAGVGLSADAVHLTAPDRHAGGAIRAARQALERAGRGPSDVHTVSVHGTGTPFNDAMEQVALDALWGRPVDVCAADPAIQLVKAAIGHTMGAAGALEAAVAVRALQRTPGAVLSMSSAFGGMNASVLFATGDVPDPSPRPVQVGPTRDAPDLRAVWPDAPLPALRANPTVRAALALVRADLLADGPLPEGGALVLSTRTGCADVDRAYHERLVTEGAASVSRLAFTYTVPAAPITEASRLLGIRGPLLCVYGPAATGLDEACRLVRHGWAPAALALDIEGGAAPTATCVRVSPART